MSQGSAEQRCIRVSGESRSCFLAGVRGRLVPVVIGLLLLVAATLKGYPLATEPPMASDISPPRWVLLGTVEFELLLGLWLVAGFWVRQARIVGLVCFVGFSIVSLSRAGEGEASCGCFGKVSISPWISAGMDLLAVMALVVWRAAGRRQDNDLSQPCAPSRRRVEWLKIGGVGVVGLAVGVVAVFAMRGSEPARLAKDGSIIGTGDVVVLEPEDWVGKRWPLLGHVDRSRELAVGEWTVLLYHRDCRVCQETIRRLLRREGEQVLRGGPRIALIEVPRAGARIASVARESPCRLYGRLNSTRKWFVKTPVLLRIEDGGRTQILRDGGQTARPATGKGNAG